MRMPLLDRGVRDSTVLPTMKCAQCNQDVHIRLIGQHKCAQQPAMPSLPQRMGDRGLSSFFDVSEDRSRPMDSHMRGAVESQAFPSAYKPSLQLLDEEISGNGDEDFDFDSMLQNVSMQRHGAASTTSLSDGVPSPGMRKVTDLGLSNSNVSIDSLAAGLSPKDFLQIAGRTSPTANGFTINHESSRQPNSARLEQAREELLSGIPSPTSTNNTNSRSATSPKSPEYSYPSTGANSQNNNSNVAALHNSLMQKMSSGAVAVPETQLSQQASPMLAANTRPSHTRAPDPAFPTLSGSSPVSPSSPDATGDPAHSGISPPPLVRSHARQNNDNNAATASANGRVGARSNSSHSQEQQRWHQPPHSAAENNSSQAAHPASRSTQAVRAEGVRGTDSNSLPIGGIMRTQATMAQRSISGSEVSRQGLSPKSSVDSRHRGDSNRSNGSSNASSNSGTFVAQETMSRGSQNHRPSPPAVSVDTQICISGRKPSAGSSAAGSLSASPHLPSSHSRSTSGHPTQPSIDISHARKPSRNATAPSAMHSASSLPSTNGIPNLAKGPLDMLASLVPSDPRGLPRSASFGRHATPPPNSQMGSIPMRNGAPNTNGMAPKGMAPMPPAGRRLKSAKLDSLLDDLMGEMQALSAEGRPESDRESLVSTASAGPSVASPMDPHAGAEMTIEDIRRARLDSTVSSTSTSSTMSNGTPHKRQLHCTACGTTIANMGRGSIARASGLPRNGEIPTGVQGIEHQGRVYCVRDYRRQIAHLCRGCGQPCESTSSRDSVHALDSWWHRKCFNCQKCHQQFPDKSFYVFDHLPYCRYDYHRLNRSLCAACKEPIEGPCAQVYEGRFHPGCFACAECGESLCDVYYSLDGHFFCEQHVHQHKAQTSPADKRKTVFGHI